jgi:hypothetical protein
VSDDPAVSESSAPESEVSEEAPKPGPRPNAPRTVEYDLHIREVEKLRQEAGKHRMEKKTAVESAETLRKELADMTSGFRNADTATAKYRAMIEAGIPTETMNEVFGLIAGDDEDSIAESVASVKALMGRTARDIPADPTQGSGNPPALNSDELEQSLRKALGMNTR